MQKIKRAVKIFLLVTALLYCLLLIPEKETTPVSATTDTAFVWNLNPLWKQLENNYVNAKKENNLQADSIINTLFVKQKSLYNSIAGHNISANDSRLDTILSNYFQLAALVAARPQYRQQLLTDYTSIRREIKQQPV